MRNVPCDFHTLTSSLPASLRLALVHLTFLGLRFILKFLWHLDLQNLNICMTCAFSIAVCHAILFKQLQRYQKALAVTAYCGIVSDKGYAMAWIDSAGAEPALLQPHAGGSVAATRPLLVYLDKCQKAS